MRIIHRPSANVKRVLVSRAFFEQLCKRSDQHFRLQNPLPKDACLINTYYDQFVDCWVLLFQSKEFSPVYEGHEVPKYDLVFQDVEEGRQ